jgi:hypothetical protein
VSRRARDVTRALVVAATRVLAACDLLGIGDDCTSNPAPAFTHMFTDLSQVRSIVPLGNPSTGGEIKERHQVQVLTDVDASGVTTSRSVPVMAAAPARLESVRRYRADAPPAPFADEYYGFVLRYSCEVTVRFDHVRTAATSCARQHRATRRGSRSRRAKRRSLRVRSSVIPMARHPRLPASRARSHTTTRSTTRRTRTRSRTRSVTTERAT